MLQTWNLTPLRLVILIAYHISRFIGESNIWRIGYIVIPYRCWRYLNLAKSCIAVIATYSYEAGYIDII